MRDQTSLFSGEHAFTGHLAAADPAEHDKAATVQFLQLIRQILLTHADEHTRSTAQYYFKEKVIFIGVKTVIVNQLARESFQIIKLMGKTAVLDLAEKLLQSGFNEEAFIAFEWAYRLEKLYEPQDMARFESWIERYVDNWAKCDTLCNHAVGSLVERFPECLTDLKRWARSENRWMRRAAAVSLILPARRGLFLPDVLEIADTLLTEKDDLVQKGTGWMLREAGKCHLQVIFDYIEKNKGRMPRTTLRYAIEKMPDAMKRQAMEK